MNGPLFTDSITLLITCDNKVFCEVTSEENDVVNLLSTKFPEKTSWKIFTTNQIAQILDKSNQASSSIYKVRKCYTPQSNGNLANFVINLVILVQVLSSPKMNSKFSNQYSKCRWITENEILKYYRRDSLGSPLLLEVFPIIQQQIFKPDKKFYPNDITNWGNYMEMTDECLVKGQLSCFDITVENCILGDNQSFLYSEFMTLCFPELLMPPQKFIQFMSKLEVPYQESLRIFNTADITSRRFLSFREFMYILACMDPLTNHVGAAKEARSYYIFRYVDTQNRGLMGLEEIKALAMMIAKSTQLPTGGHDIKNEVKMLAGIFKINNDSSGIKVEEFVAKVDEYRGKGISYCFRLPKSVKTLCPKMKPTVMISKFNSLRMINKASIPHPHTMLGDGTYEIAKNSPRICVRNSSITFESISELRGACSLTSLQTFSGSTKLVPLDPRFMANETIKNIRYLAGVNNVKSGNRGKEVVNYKWGRIDKTVFGRTLLQICLVAKGLFQKDPRLLELKSPIYVTGDFHGNFGDLLYFEKMFWPLTLYHSPCSVLCLGDYVDRGAYGMELCAYMFCMKILNPTKVYLVRGNHETRSVQETFDFPLECGLKFGEFLGKEIWEAINNVFDVLPLAAIVNGKIFCCHGGIPPPWIAPTIYAVRNIPSPLPTPNTNSSLAWELLWNDPIRDADISEEMLIEMNANEGFYANRKRGTAHVFSCKALEKFLRTHNFSHVIRAHETVHSGYAIDHKGKLITIFSSSRYNNLNNESASVLLVHNKMQFIRFAPSNLQNDSVQEQLM